LLIALATPILLISLPIIMTKKFYQYSVETEINSIRCFFVCIFIFICTLILTPLIVILALLIGVPSLIFFIYFYMPRRFISSNF
jgi:hypothetical protein